MAEAARDAAVNAISPAQYGWWYLEQLTPGSPALHTSLAYRIAGELDGVALRAAWREVLRRHEVLRTGFGTQAWPVPQVSASEVDPASFVYVRERVQPSPAGQIVLGCAEWVRAPFDLARGPGVRLVLIRLGHYDHCLLLVAHRSAADERSLAILSTELSTAYTSTLDALAVPAQAPVNGYADVVEWQRHGQDPALAGDRLNWWVDALTPAPVPLALPADRIRAGGPASAAGTVAVHWDEPTGSDLLRFASAVRVGPDAVLLAALLALLGRYHRVDRLAVGVPAVGVPAGSAFADVVGPLENLLVVPADLEGEITFRDLTGRVATALAGARSRREVPFADLVRALRPPRDPQRIPLCDAVLTVRDPGRPGLSLAGTLARPLTVHPGATLYDLALTVDRLSPRVTGALTYRTQMFDRLSAHRMAGQLRTLLAAALTAPDTPLAGLPLDSPARLAAAIRDADRIAAAAVPRHSVPDLIRRRAAGRHEAPAVRSGSGVVTYGELLARADAVATALRAVGDVAGRPVLVRMPSGPDQFAALVGAQDAGAHLVWFGMGDPGERGRAAMTDVRPVAVLVDAAAEDDDPTGWYPPGLAERVISVTSLPGTGTADPRPPRPGLSDLAYVAYTSGSTGRPKGIAQSQAALAQFATWLGTEFGLGPGSRVAQWVAPEHDPAICEVFAALIAGATLCPTPAAIRRHPEKFVDWLAAEGITFLQVVPSFAREILRVVVDRGATERLARLDRLVLMGEALHEDLVNGLRTALPLARLANVYGPTETVAATWYDITGPVSGSTPIGRPIPGRLVVLLDDQDRPCPAGVTGNILIHSPYVAAGYLGAAAADRAAFQPPEPLPATTPGGWYRTGDVGRLRWDGNLEYRGRRDLQVKLSGNRVELTDVEAALASHESVAECAVTALADRDGLVSRLVAYLVPRPGAAGSPAVWRAHLRSRFGRSMMPVLFHVLDEPLPRTVAGKVDRRRLPDPGPASAPAGRAPRGALEKELAGILTGLLGVERIGAEESFFALGGHSLLVPELLRAVRERLGVQVPMRRFLADPSLASLAGLVASALPTEGDGTGQSTVHSRPTAATDVVAGRTR
jgi:(S)-beta-tyrosine adenylation enzyme